MGSVAPLRLTGLYMADFDGLEKGKISNVSTFKELRSITLQGLKFDALSALHCFVVGPPLKALPDKRERKKKVEGEGLDNIIPRVAEIVFKSSGAQVNLDNALVLRDVEFLIENELLSCDEGTFSLVLVEKKLGLTDWLGESFESVFGAVRAQTKWRELSAKHAASATISKMNVPPDMRFSVPTTTMEISHIDKIAENYKSMLLESMVADFLLDRLFHGDDVVTCYDHLLLKLWTFNHWVYCERFCGFNHEKTSLGK
jgi:hypothetical protein